MLVCMYVYVYVCIICMNILMYICTHMHVHTCTYVITYVCMYVFVTLLAIADYNTLWMEVHDTYTPVMQRSAVIFEIGN